MRKLAERDNVFIIQDGSKIKTLIKDTYTSLKINAFDGNRIFYDFGDGLKVQETYDERIFNCYKGEEVINIRDGNKICEFIQDTNSSGYDSYFKQHYYEQHRTEFIDEVMKSYGDRVEKVPDGYIIDEIWKVNSQGSSYYLQQNHKGRFDSHANVRVHGENAKGVEGDWHFLCTVAQGQFLKMSIDTKIGSLELDETTMTILAKINYLMNPSAFDTTTLHQLPDKLRKVIQDEKQENINVLNQGQEDLI